MVWEAVPGFAAMQSWPLDQHVLRIDDFRLTKTSPARNHGAQLPGDLADRDPDPADGVRDIGCFEYGAAPLAVGVGGRRRFLNASRESRSRLGRRTAAPQPARAPAADPRVLSSGATRRALFRMLLDLRAQPTTMRI